MQDFGSIWFMAEVSVREGATTSVAALIALRRSTE
jgi:hypothetical protein